MRVYKTRTLASDECDKGHVLVNGNPAKPSKVLSVGDRIDVRKLPLTYQYEVLAMPSGRLSASLVPNYMKDNTPQSVIDDYVMMTKSSFVTRDRGAGRPTKKERREIDRWMDDTVND